MPVGPYEANILNNMSKDIRNLIKYIDKCLEKEYNGESWISIPIAEINDKTFKIIESLYKSAGWKRVVFNTKNGRETATLQLWARS